MFSMVSYLDSLKPDEKKKLRKITLVLGLAGGILGLIATGIAIYLEDNNNGK